MAKRPAFFVSIVTWNSAAEIGQCLEGLRQQSFRNFRVGILDNASADRTLRTIRHQSNLVSVLVTSPENLGYSGGHNRLLARVHSDYVLFLNPDVRLAPDFLEKAHAALEHHPECGSLAPRLLRMAGAEEAFAPLRFLDSAGMFWTRSQRHFDRGSGEPDDERYRRAEYVFGPSGAAAVYRRACLEDVAFGKEVWDEDFFAYREDADLAWRAAWRGWKCLYAPEATAWHVRKVLPRGRNRYPAEVNRHSVKNRFLLRLKNLPVSTFLRFSPWILARDLCVIGGVFLKEVRSIPAFWQVLRLIPRFRVKRRHVMANRKAGAADLARWFTRTSRPLATGVNNLVKEVEHANSER